MKRGMRMWIELIQLTSLNSGRLCENGNEFSDSVKDGKAA